MFSACVKTDSQNPKVFSSCPKIATIAIAIAIIVLLAISLAVPAVSRFMTSNANVPNWVVFMLIAIAGMVSTALYTVARHEALKQQQKADAEKARIAATKQGDKSVGDSELAIAKKAAETAKTEIQAAQRETQAAKDEAQKARSRMATFEATASAHEATIGIQKGDSKRKKLAYEN